jgi:hypothetical protein
LVLAVAADHFDSAGQIVGVTEGERSRSANEGVVFDGVPRTEVTTQWIPYNSPFASEAYGMYTYLERTADARVTTYAEVFTLDDADTQRSERTVSRYDPPLSYALNIGLGESATNVYDGTIIRTRTVNGVEQPIQIVPLSQSETTLFATMETVAVPAGTFTTCVFKSSSSSTKTFARWHAPGVGLTVREDAYEGTLLVSRMELVLVTRNGTPVTVAKSLR